MDISDSDTSIINPLNVLAILKGVEPISQIILVRIVYIRRERKVVCPIKLRQNGRLTEGAIGIIPVQKLDSIAVRSDNSFCSMTE